MGKNKCKKSARKHKEKSGKITTVCNQPSEQNTSTLDQSNESHDNVILLNQSMLIEAIINALQSISKRSSTKVYSIADAAINGDFKHWHKFVNC